MNQVALQTFSSFDTGGKPSEELEPERFYHGFVLGLIWPENTESLPTEKVDSEGMT